MLILRVEFLTGRCVATSFHDRERAEWPPHPARLFSALVAAWSVGGRAEDEAAALRWLEGQPPPALYASEASHRSVVTHFVPVNDTSVLGQSALTKAWHRLQSAEKALADSAPDLPPKARARLEAKRQKLAVKLREAGVKEADKPFVGKPEDKRMLPQERVRQARTFPSVTPEEPVVFFRWRDAPPEPLAVPLARVVSRISRLGHSSSVVACAVVAGSSSVVVPEPNWWPDPHGEQVLRVPEAGQLERLRSAYDVHQAVEPRVLGCDMAPYRCGGAEVVTAHGASLFGRNFVVFRVVDGPRLSLTQAVRVARAVRGALLRHADEAGEMSELVSGHGAGGEPSQRPHLAIMPLPFVGHDHADGFIKGVALALPDVCEPADRRSLLRTVGMWERAGASHNPDAAPSEVRLTLGRAGVLTLQRQIAGARPLRSLQERTWTRPARRWASVTPVALDRNPGDLDAADAAARDKAVANACRQLRRAAERIGLPAPRAVELTWAPPLVGSRPVRDFPAYPPDRNKPGSPRRVKVHAVLTFDHPVLGPVLLGAGRYVGLGLFRPLPKVTAS